MKYLFSISAVLAFALSSCMNVPGSAQENTTTATAFAEDLPETTPAESDTGEDTSAISVEVVGGDDESLREFIRQWLTPAYPNPSGTSQDITVYVGSLPKDLPYDLPTPDDARLIASITGDYVDYQLMFDSSLSSETIQEFYAQNLADKGWREVPTNQGVGFVHQPAVVSGSYCHEDGDGYLTVATPAISDEKNSIRISLFTSRDPHFCEAAPTRSGESYLDLLPNLESPSGTMVGSSGAGSSDTDAEFTTSLQSDLSPAELVEFYNEQLVTAGWEMQDSGSGEGTAWSHWTFTDEQGTHWFGSLIVMKASANRDKLFALVRIEKDD